ncbi:MAG: GTPase RsgA [Clostridia bacterium]|nr:GTPase RsgA [Clostridia bacterium]
MHILVFDNITILYGNNGSGKSTILNIIAHKLNLKGKEISQRLMDGGHISKTMRQNVNMSKDFYYLHYTKNSVYIKIRYYKLREYRNKCVNSRK